MVVLDYTAPNILTKSQRTPELKYGPYAVRAAAEKLKTNKYLYADLARNKSHEFAESLGVSRLVDLGNRLSSSQFGAYLAA
jgi:hypothetical protein